MDPHDIAVATMTLARDAHEEHLVRAALLGLSRTLPGPLAVSDGGSPASFRAFLAELPRAVVVAPAGPGLVGQVRASLEAASSASCDFILYTESDKHGFFGGAVADFIGRVPDDLGTGIAVASRGAAAFATFPAMQRQTETSINTLTGEAIGLAADYSYGPFLLHRSLARYLAAVTADIGWGWRHYLFVVAHRLGYRVVTIEGDYRCPGAQRQEDDADRVHRLRQLAQNVQGLILGLTVPLG